MGDVDTVRHEFEKRTAEAARLSSLQAPKETPYCHKYEGRAELETLRARLQAFPDVPACVQALGIVDYHLGINFLDTEELASGEASLTAALKILDPTPDSDGGEAPSAASEANDATSWVKIEYRARYLVDLYNRLGVLWNDRGEYSKADEFLQKALDAYRRKKPSLPTPSASTEASSENAKRTIEDEHTMSYYYLAQVAANLKKPKASAKYCAITLKRQLESGSFDHQDWALNCVNLSAYHRAVGHFGTAERCLHAAASIKNDTDGEYGGRLALGWGKLHVDRLKAAYEKRKAAVEEASNTGIPVQLSSADSGSASKEANDEIESIFASLKLPSATLDAPINSYEEAREVFKPGQDWLEKAKMFFVLDGYVTDHCNILWDQSQLYKYLATFEMDASRALIMTKRRAALLEPIIDAINPKAYDEIWKDYTMELAEIWREAMDAKIYATFEVEEDYNPRKDASAMKKITEWGKAGLKYYALFLKSFETSEGVFPDPPPSNYEYLVLTAHFCSARIWTRLCPPASPSLREEIIENMKKGLKEYEWCVNYCNKHNPSCFKAEAELAKQMLQVVPLRITGIATGALNYKPLA
eukprot:tig00020538_g10373.t1